jgi:hypothetical protein
MRKRWPISVLVLTSFLLASGAGQGQEAAHPAPPWAETLPPTEPIREASSLFALDEEANPWNTGNIWVRPEYVLSWIHSSNLPPLVSTGLTTDSRPGALGRDFTRVLYGAAPLNYQDRHGFRITAGGTFGEDNCHVIEAAYLTVGGRVQRFQSTSPGSPVLARPFFDALNNAEDSSLTTYPGFLSGSLQVDSTSYLQSAEMNLFETLGQTETTRVRAIIGFRQLRIHESLGIHESSTVTDATNALFGQSVSVRDGFNTTNNFYGAQVGLSAEYRWRRFTAELYGKAALGDVQQRVTIDGSTEFQGNTFGGGLLAQSSNIGSYARDRFGVVPEGGTKLQAAIGKCVLVHVGYSFLFLGNAVRPGNHVDTSVNPNLVPTSATFGAAGGPARPAFQYHDSTYWAHLFNFGLTIQY